MTEYLDMNGMKLKKGFYKTIFIPGLPGEGGNPGGDIIYFTGKYKGEPIFKSMEILSKNSHKKEFRQNEYFCRKLEKMSNEELNKNIQDLELKLDWFNKVSK